uniref:Phosphatase PAP2 family protein n=1 Tax=Roseihalotalea indica TaxID=2867963 RepID=A0AA49GP29_9BACT|nr:phosphatase PAP2 family protein [Tunicatimonas sp. TK19036]
MILRIYRFWGWCKLSVLVVLWLNSASATAQYSVPPNYDSTLSQPSKEYRSEFRSGMIPMDALVNSSSWTQSILYKTIAAPTFLITGGLLTFNDNRVFDKYDVQQARQKAIPNFHTSADDYLQYMPIVAVYGLKATGIKTQHRFMAQTLRLLTAEALSQAVVLPLKQFTHIERPDQSNFKSFPSGHTTQAFVSATFMHKELGHLSPWYSIGAYTTATAVGALRMMNNKHWLSDVLVGAGIGILSTNVAYLIFPERNDSKEKASSLIVTPIYYEGVVGFNLLISPH